MKLAIAVCLFALFASVIAADIDSTGQAKLLYVRSIRSSTHGGSTQVTRFHVEVQNIAFEKYVAIHLKNPKTNAWEDLPLSWRSAGAINTADNTKSTDVFTGELTIDSEPGAPITGPIEYTVKYSVAGNTYWQKNTTSGQNYVIPADFGAILANGQEVYAGDYQSQITLHRGATSTKVPYTFQVYAKSKNAAGQAYKSVLVRVSEDAGKTTTDVRCSFSANTYSGWYSAAQNPNVAGYEAWDCEVPVSTNTIALQFTAVLKYEGAANEIWDNNWDKYYKSTIAWKAY